MNDKLLIGIVITSAILIGGVIFLSQKSAQNTSPDNTIQTAQSNPQKAPDFTLPKYDGLGDVNLASLYNDKPTVIQFWATWCEICRAEFPKNNQIAAKYKDQINYIAVDWAQGDKQAVASYIKELNLDPSLITFVMDDSGGIGAKYGVRGIPVHIFIKKGGEISLMQTGGLRPDILENEIKKIL